jgi:hypothetical protein
LVKPTTNKKKLKERGYVQMAKVAIVGDNFMLISSVKAATIKKLARYRPEALQSIESEGQEKKTTFVIRMGSTPSCNRHGVNFTGETTNGEACITLPFPKDIKPEDKTAYVTDVVMDVLPALNKLEAAIAEAEVALAQDMETVATAVETLI